MRHRFTVALYDEYPVEAEVLDYLVSHGRGKRQEVLRMLVKAGYAAMMQHKDASSAMMNAVDPDALALLVQALSGANGALAPGINHQPSVSPQPPHHGSASPTQNPATPPPTQEYKKPPETPEPPEVPLQEPGSGGMDYDPSLSEFEPDEDMAEPGSPQEISDDDLEDPMAKLMGL